ncbi:MAG: TetR/AcrR family transcriptional regulator [Thauera sp.]|nr:TetR/AcrR family transcriptional regulator [Thauera sp.]
MSAADKPEDATPPGGRATPRRRRKEARPGELLAAALELFVDKGYAATRLDDVAARAGVAKGTLYLYFDNKEALFRAVVEQGIVPVFDAAESEIADYRGSTAELLVELLHRWLREVGSTSLAGLYQLILAESHSFPELALYYEERVIQRGRALIAEVLRRGMQSGEFHALDVEAAVDAIIAPFLTIVVRRFSPVPCGRTVDPEALLQAHINLLLHGLCVQKRTP